MMSSILRNFPQGYVPRKIQTQILQEVEQQMNSGYKTIILSAPTGVGKSLIGATIAKHLGSSFIVTASKQLQDQYTKDITFLKPVKGKSNFPCLKLMEDEGLEKDYTQASKLGLTCEKGVCKETKTKNGKKIEEICKYKPQIDTLQEDYSDKEYCHYYLQKYLALLSEHSIWNYSAYFQLMKFNKQIFLPYIERPVAIYDEAHQIEDQIIQFIGIDIYNRNLEECGINAKSYDLTNIDLIISLLDDLATSYARQIREITETRSFQMNPDYMLLSRLEERYRKVSDARVEILSGKDNFVISEPRTDNQGNFNSLSVKPLDISKYVGLFFHTKFKIFMSATIEKESFCENTGMNQSGVAYIDTPQSPFLSSNRRLQFLNVSKLSYRSSHEDEMAVVKKIDEILLKHYNQRGLILTSSEKRCVDIKQNLSDKNRQRIRICHSKNEYGKTQDEILVEHSKD